MGHHELIDDYRKLRVYRSAFAAAMTIFKASKCWPKEERYALTDQIRRSSRSVCSNIAEAWFKRRYAKHFVSKLSDASMEAGETLTWIDFAVSCGYLSVDEQEDLTQTYRAIIGGLTKMMTRPDQWCLPKSKLREPAADYSLDA